VSFLLDTHALAWALFNPDDLSPKVRDLIEDEATRVHFSPISLFEMETKAAIGKWPWVLPPDWTAPLRNLAVAELPVLSLHGAQAGRLPLYHRDPWDRLLIAQAQIEGMVLVSLDPVFARYEVNTFW